MIKKLFIVIVILVLLALAVVYAFRHEIFQVSAETIIKKNLPSYITVEAIVFDLKNGVMRVKEMGIKNPPEFTNKELAHIRSITCTYKMKGDNILDGIEVTGIEASGGTIIIERLSDGRLNVNEMGPVMEEGAKRSKSAQQESKGGNHRKSLDISRWIKLPDTIDLKEGKVVFLDNAVMPRPYRLTFEDIDSELGIRLNKDYTKVTAVSSKGTGSLQGDRAQQVRWITSLDPDRRELTMSNRFEISNIDIIPFRPYYDPYSPLEIQSGVFSGTLVFDFDNGNIGSTNTVRLRNLRFRQKMDDSSQRYWVAAIPDIIKYLETSPGEITFDFKIKGPMDDPRFYPGPVVKRAIQNMAVDKISELLAPPEEQEGQVTEKSDAQKVVDVISELLKNQDQ